MAYCLSQQFLRLLAEGIASRVVSMPCRELFEKESAEYRHSVLPPVVTAKKLGFTAEAVVHTARQLLH